MTVEINDLWMRIKNYAEENIKKKQLLLSGLGEFYILESGADYIKIDKISIKMKKEMFLSIFQYLENHQGWIRIGASRVNTKPNTIEGFIKDQFFKKNPNALSTAPWFSAILVYSNIGVKFNKNQKGQALRYRFE